MRKILAAFVIGAGVAAAQGVCDRACLTGILDQYLNAMAANDAKKAPFAANTQSTPKTRRGFRSPKGCGSRPPA